MYQHKLKEQLDYSLLQLRCSWWGFAGCCRYLDTDIQTEISTTGLVIVHSKLEAVPM